MPQIVRAEFLCHINFARNNDKVFNVFVIEDDDGTFRCVTEYGRRGSNLVRDTLCVRATRDTAESKLRQKLLAKRNHRETPYMDDFFGHTISRLAREYSFNLARNENANQASQSTPARTATPQKQNVIAFPAEKREKPRQKQKQSGILNQEQFDSLEI